MVRPLEISYYSLKKTPKPPKKTKTKNQPPQKKTTNSTKKIGIEQNFLSQNDLVSLTIKLSFSNQLH